MHAQSYFQRKIYIPSKAVCSLSHISTIVTYVLRVMADNAVQSGAEVTNVVSDAGAQIDQHPSNDGDQIAASEVHPAGVDVVGNHGLYRCNRPKRSDADEVIPPGRLHLHPDEFAMIEELKSIPFKPTAIVSEINGSFVSRQNFQDLLRPHAYINGDVLSMYIELLREQEHLLSRGGAKVFLEDTFVTSILKKDGEIPIEDVQDSDGSFIRERITIYLDHDLIFLPVN
ncbi:hypothetical protein EJB05_39187, partial [Eragrostis curvula]